MHSMSLPLAVFTETHLILLLIILLLLFGGKKLPELARGLGEAMREFKKASRDIPDDHPTPAAKPEAPASTASTTPNNQQPKSS
jgi:sec-independent protein translocase protein TatA